eukprot:TRINITY_DN391_c0_g1_i10.p1 TRINITY_DN391_c0_g1~~TRINITY_DN391_c0_g1_i10.p1  ORF type:complete len:690 (-),score=277.79 TRINITY_DN391_c0_g1_i10:60-1997(-)
MAEAKIEYPSSGFTRENTALDIVQTQGTNLQGRVVLITGASSGIGVETVRALATAKAHVVVAVRDVAKTEPIVAELKESTQNEQIDIMSLDLSSTASIRQFVDAFVARDLPLHILICNAGVMACPESKTADGFEMQFGTNHLGHFLLVNLLTPTLLKHAKNGTKSRVVVVSSLAHVRSDIHWDDVNFTQGYDKWLAYGQSKTANMLFALEYNRRYSVNGIIAFSLHPGVIMTELGRHFSDEDRAMFQSRFTPDILKSIPQGASTSVWAATSPLLENYGGQYLDDNNIQTKYNAYALDPASASRLWTLSEQLLGQSFPYTLTGFGYRTNADDVVETLQLDWTGRVVIVTGAASGIGVETAHAMAKSKAHVIMAVRDVVKGEEVAASIRASTGNPNVEPQQLDLSSLQSVSQFAEQFKASGRPLHTIICNAGIMATPQSTTADGFESQFGTNHLGHFTLVNLLTPLLLKSAETAADVRVVVVSSVAHRRNGLDLDDLMFERRPYDKWVSYAQSKTANIYFAIEYNRRYAPHGVEAFSLHPGGIMTGLQKHMDPMEVKGFGWVDAEGKPNARFKTPQQGAATSVVAASSPLLRGQGGRFLEDCNFAAITTNPVMYGLGAHGTNAELAARLWEASERLVSPIVNLSSNL